MTGAASLSWFAQHEFRLAWRDWSWFLSGGRRTKDIALLVGIVVFVAGFHGFAYVLLEPYLFAGQAPAKTILLPLSGAILLTFSMMLSQALEMVTRAFYARDDLDLILSSPAPADDLFVVRIAMLAFSNTLLNMALTAPFINAAAVLAGPQWLAAYGIVIAASLIATGTAVFLVLGLFLTVGAKRTRLIAQIIAAIVSASFLIGLQVIAIIVYGSMSRWDIMTSSWLSDTMPALDTAVWIPARAASGDFGALALVLIPALLFFALAARRGAKSFQGIVLSAAAVGEERASRVRTRPTFAVGSTHGALVRKEWKLLKRDAWLVSQTLMQVFYLIPPALMMWDSYGSNNPVSVILAPVIVMAIGQLAGGLAWLAISGEDAPDLIATAPITPFALLNAKVQAVLAIILVLVAPFVLAMTLLSVWGAFVTFVGALTCAALAIIIQLWFRAQAKRSMFRRRQVASKASTFCEAFVSLLCAATASIAVAGQWFAIIPAFLVLCVMGIAWLLSPKAI